MIMPCKNIVFITLQCRDASDIQRQNHVSKVHVWRQSLKQVTAGDLSMPDDAHLQSTDILHFKSFPEEEREI
jgi:hypothetical protein